MMASSGYYLPETIFAQDGFAEIVLDNEELLKTMYETKSYRYLYSRCAKKKLNKDFMDFSSINPAINTCLNYALANLNKYRSQAIDILKFAKNHNERIRIGFAEKLGHLYMDECGGLRDWTNNHEIVQVVIFIKEGKINDAEVADLIKQVPTFRKFQ